MLVLTRKKGQSLTIGCNIRVVLLDITGETVRVGIEAPPEVVVYRSEIYQAVRDENKSALASREMAARLKDMASLETSSEPKE